MNATHAPSPRSTTTSPPCASARRPSPRPSGTTFSATSRSRSPRPHASTAARSPPSSGLRPDFAGRAARRRRARAAEAGRRAGRASRWRDSLHALLAHRGARICGRHLAGELALSGGYPGVPRWRPSRWRRTSHGRGPRRSSIGSPTLAPDQANRGTPSGLNNPMSEVRADRTGPTGSASPEWNTAMNRVTAPSTRSSYTMSAWLSPIWGRESGWTLSILTASAGRRHVRVQDRHPRQRVHRGRRRRRSGGRRGGRRGRRRGGGGRRGPGRHHLGGDQRGRGDDHHGHPRPRFPGPAGVARKLFRRSRDTARGRRAIAPALARHVESDARTPRHAIRLPRTAVACNSPSSDPSHGRPLTFTFPYTAAIGHAPPPAALPRGCAPLFPSAIGTNGWLCGCAPVHRDPAPGRRAGPGGRPAPPGAPRGALDHSRPVAHHAALPRRGPRSRPGGRRPRRRPSGPVLRRPRPRGHAAGPPGRVRARRRSGGPRGRGGGRHRRLRPPARGPAVPRSPDPGLRHSRVAAGTRWASPSPPA